jgi:cold shock protein
LLLRLFEGLPKSLACRLDPEEIRRDMMKGLEMNKASGTVKWFDPTKGYGFIKPSDGGRDVFIHITAVRAAGLQNLNEGQAVAYEIRSERGKSAAANIEIR